MIDKKSHFIFSRYDGYGKEPDLFVSDHHNYEDAVFEFLFQTLGYQIIKVKTGEETSINAEHV